MRRLPVAAFVALAAATIAAFFVTQHLKVATPLLAGSPAPHPAAINPIDGRVCQGVSHRRMFVSFYLLNRSDDVDVSVQDTAGNLVAALADGVHMVAGRHPLRRGFTWNGRTASGAVAPDGTYYIRVFLIHQGRTVLISNNAGGAEPVTEETVPPRQEPAARSRACSSTAPTWPGAHGWSSRLPAATGRPAPGMGRSADVPPLRAPTSSAWPSPTEPATRDASR